LIDKIKIMKTPLPLLKNSSGLAFFACLIISLGLFCSACNDSTTANNSAVETPQTPASSEVAEKEKAIEVVKDDRVPLYLSGLYATSTAPGSDVRSVFDGNDNTIWETIAGAGPDEGIMLYFSEETYIKSIRIERVNEEGFSIINSASFYGNGSPQIKDLEVFDFSVSKEYLNVYLRFYTDQHVTTSASEIENDYYDKIELERFDKNQKIGIKSIIIEGKDGEYKIIPPRLVEGEVEATSTLNAESFAYDPSLLFDARKEFVWVEGAKGNGEGEQLLFEFAEEVDIAGLQIWNGYQRSDSHFKSNARLKSFAFGEESKEAKSYQLIDESGMQTLKLDVPLKGKRFILEIESAFPGRSYKDLAISEILFVDKDGSLFGIESKRPMANREKILQAAKGTVLETLVDSRVFNEYFGNEDFPGSLTRSAILRSDGTFVLYSSEESEISGSQYETIADGNWEILAADETTATLSVFGKFLDFSQLEMFYAGKTDAELSRIFRDKITIRDNTIKGEKLVSVIKF